MQKTVPRASVAEHMDASCMRAGSGTKRRPRFLPQQGVNITSRDARERLARGTRIFVVGMPRVFLDVHSPENVKNTSAMLSAADRVSTLAKGGQTSAQLM